VSETALATYAGELKAWRERMGLTQQAFADKLGYSAALVAAVEQCKRSPTADFAARCDEVTDAPGTFARWQAQVARESYPAFFAPVLAFEHDAVRIHGWEIGAVPGLLQTDDYARALIRASRSQDSDDAVERMVTARVERQAILSRENPPALWYVLDEGILRRVVGSRSVMADQLDKLVTLAGVPGIVVQVLPYAVGDHAGTDGPISVFEFQDAPTVCYTECYGGGRIIEGRDEVAELVTAMSMLRASALSPRETLELMSKMRSEVDGS
jgi:transcriptional regulator with XRE-family HTH domain